MNNSSGNFITFGFDLHSLARVSLSLLMTMLFGGPMLYVGVVSNWFHLGGGGGGGGGDRITSIADGPFEQVWADNKLQTGHLLDQVHANQDFLWYVTVCTGNGSAVRTLLEFRATPNGWFGSDRGAITLKTEPRCAVTP